MSIKRVNKNCSQELAEALGANICDKLSSAIRAKGQATLVVSGGSTPKPLFNYLSNQDIEWDKVTVCLADERCVSESDSASNTAMVKAELIKNKAANAKFVNIYQGKSHDDLIDSNLTLLRLPTYDVVILGMGDDGHTASIFPEAENRDQSLDTSAHRMALLTDPVTVTPLRITQTAKRLLDSEFIALHISGEKKTALVNEIIENPDPIKWPVSFFLTQQQVPVEIYHS